MDKDGNHLGGQGNWGYCGDECPNDIYGGKQTTFDVTELTTNLYLVHGMLEMRGDLRISGLVQFMK